MIKNIFTNLFILSTLFSSYSFAQNHNHKTCGTDDLYELSKHNPEAKKQFDAMNVMHYNERSNKTAANYSPSEYIIPVVVHVIHDNTNTPAGGKIDAGQVVSEFQQLFNDYRRVPGTLGYGSGVDTKVEFSLATIDPDGNPTTGINYVVDNNLSDHEKTTEEASLKALSRWDPTMYLNIYLVKNITISGSSSGGIILGYATFPNGATNLDGLVIRSDCFGNATYYPTGYYPLGLTIGRTTVHESGHWLNLFHTFNFGCANNGDLVIDTPPTANANYSSPPKQNTCNETNDKLDDTRNFMDYADDAYADKYTNGQVTRMKSALNTSSNQLRYNLWQDDNLIATGTGPYKKPMTNFWSWNQKPIVGQPVEFIEYCAGLPSSFNWKFTNGANVITATGPNPNVTFTVAGNWDAKLVISNNAGSDSLTKTSFINVTASPSALPLNLDFQTATFPPTGWSLINEDALALNNKSFIWTQTAGGFGNSSASMRLDFFGSKGIGQIDNFISPVFTSTGPMYLEYAYAYSPLSFSGLLVGDTLAVYISTDGGNTYPDRILYKGGLDLRTTATTYTSAFANGNAPNGTQWKKEEIDLSAYSGTALRLKFSAINAYGNNLYIDDIKIANGNVQVLEPSFATINIAPNPFQDLTSLNINLKEHSNISYSVLDLQGRGIYNSENQLFNIGNHEFNIDLSQQSSGLYFVKVNVGNSTSTYKIMNLK